MTTFKKTLLVNEEEKTWLLEEFKSLQFDNEWEENYNFNKEHEIEFLDKHFISDLADDWEDPNTKEKFYRWIKVRDFWLSKLKVYEKKYKKLGFNIDAFPNFTINVNSTTLSDKYEINFTSDYYKHDNTHNPFLLGLFLQKFLMKFYSTKIIKFSYIEKNRRAGVLIIDAEKIKAISINQIKDDFEIKDKYDIRPPKIQKKELPQLPVVSNGFDGQPEIVANSFTKALNELADDYYINILQKLFEAVSERKPEYKLGTIINNLKEKNEPVYNTLKYFTFNDTPFETLTNDILELQFRNIKWKEIQNRS